MARKVAKENIATTPKSGEAHPGIHAGIMLVSFLEAVDSGAEADSLEVYLRATIDGAQGSDGVAFAQHVALLHSPFAQMVSSETLEKPLGQVA